MKMFVIVKANEQMKIGDNLETFMRDNIERNDYLQLGKNNKQFNQDSFLRDTHSALKDYLDWTEKGIRQNYIKYALVLTTDKYKIKGIIRF